MTTTDDTTTVRLTGRSGLLAAVPAMLGFHPQESLVMVCMAGPRRRVGPVIRVDLTDPADSTEPLDAPIAQLRHHAEQYSDEVAVLCYTEQVGRPKLLDDALVGLQSAGVVVLDALLIRDGRAVPAGRGCTLWTVRNEDEDEDEDDADAGCAVPTTDHPQARAMAAASALHGRGILPNRQALRDSIAGPTGRAAQQATAALHAAATGLMATIGPTGPIDRTKVQDMATTASDRALAEVTGGSGVGAATCASIAILLCDVEIRDLLIARSVQDSDEPWVPMLIAVACATPDEDAAQVCAVLAVAAYRRGDGALAQVAVDRCLSAEPDHRLAHLMLGVMAAGLPPAELAELAQSSQLSRETGE